MLSSNDKRTWFKVGALASSTILVCGAIAYSIGAFDSMLSQESASKAPTLIGGSKSIVIREFVPAPTVTEPPVPTEPNK